MNNTSSNSATLESMTQYVCFGSIAVVSNLIIIFILFSNIPYLKKSAFMCGLTFGDLIDGMALLVNGAVRIQLVFEDTLFFPVHPSYCMKTFLIPIFLLGNQIPGVMFFLIGVERFVAVYCYEWYYAKWSNKLAWMLTTCAYVFCIVSLLAAFVIAFNFPNTFTIIKACTTASVIGSTYSAYNYAVAIVGGTSAIVGSMIAMLLFTWRRNRVYGTSEVSRMIKNHVKNQWYLTKITLCLATADLGLVVIPSFLIMLTSGFNINVGNIKNWSLQLVCLRSSLNIIMYMVVNSEFRAAALKAFGWKKKVQVTNQKCLSFPKNEQKEATNF